MRRAIDKYASSIGPYIALSGGSAKYYNVESLKSEFTVNKFPDFGVSGFIPISKQYSGSDEILQLGIYGDLGYSTISYKNIVSDNKNINWITKSSYLTLNTTFCIMGSLIGCFIGLPLSGKMEYPDSAVTITSNLNFIFGIRFGFILPLYYDNIGRLNIYANYSIILTKQFSSNGLPEYNSEKYNTEQIAITIGLNYLFKLTD
ncbi:MAG: hypothetical protein HZB41_07760 [Ignavibacteriae bacterium]|nr:hypothetical protein [Ignavibacteriota bacterium]